VTDKQTSGQAGRPRPIEVDKFINVSGLGQISLPWQQGYRRPHNILHGSIGSAIPENLVVGANISQSICHTSRLRLYKRSIVCNCKFCGANFGPYRGLKSKIEDQTFCRVPHEELTAKKWLDSIEKQKSNLKFVRDGQAGRRLDLRA